MKKSILVLVFILSVSLVSAEVELSFISGDCLEDGSIKLQLQNTGSEQISTKDIKVFLSNARPQGSGRKGMTEVGLDPDAKILLSGTWSDEYVEELSMNKPAFSTDSEVAPYTALYDIVAEYNGCSKEVGCKITKKTTNLCASSKVYGCDITDFHIIECYNSEGKGHIKFSGVQEGFMQNLDPMRNVRYHLETTKTTFDTGPSNSNPASMKVESLGSDTYLFTIDHAIDGKLDKIKLTHDFCGEDFAKCTDFIPEQPIITEVQQVQDEEESDSGFGFIMRAIVGLIALAMILFFIFKMGKKK